VAERTREPIAHEYGHLNQSQRTAVDQILASRDQVTALEGAAGTGKTTALKGPLRRSTNRYVAPLICPARFRDSHLSERRQP
jgi:predicted ribonuclease YlaK